MGTRWFILLAASLVLPACGDRGPGAAAVPAPETRVRPAVVVTAPLVGWLVAELAGDAVERRALGWGLGAASEPPSAEAIAEAASADLIVAHGGGLEAWLETAALPESRVLVAGSRWIEVEGETHSHGPEGEHSHAGPDPHSWLDPERVEAEARAIAERLQALPALDPAAATAVPARLERLLLELGQLAASVEETRGLVAGQHLAATGGHYRYLADALGAPLRDVSFDEPAELAHQVEHLDSWLSKNRHKLLLCSSELPADIGAALAERGIELVLLDPLTDPGGARGFDYLRRMGANLETLRGALGAPLDATP